MVSGVIYFAVYAKQFGFPIWISFSSGCDLVNLTKADVQRLLRGLWIHFEGDSLARDTYYDLLEALDCPDLQRNKTHDDQVATKLAHNTLVTIRFDPTKGSTCPKLGSWTSFGVKDRPYPDIWVYNTGLWDLLRRTKGRSFKRRMDCTLKLKPTFTLGIVRLNTLYAVNRTGNSRLGALNSVTQLFVVD